MYAVFVIAAILLSSAPMHAHALLAAILPPTSTPARHQNSVKAVEPPSLADATRTATRDIAAPSARSARPLPFAPSASPAPVLLSEDPVLAHAPNAP